MCSITQTDAIALFTSTIQLYVRRRELRRCLCICVKEFNMEQSAQFRDGAIIMSKRDCGSSTSNLVETVTARCASRDTLSRSVGQLERM